MDRIDVFIKIDSEKKVELFILFKVGGFIKVWVLLFFFFSEFEVSLRG